MHHILQYSYINSTHPSIHPSAHRTTRPQQVITKPRLRYSHNPPNGGEEKGKRKGKKSPKEIENFPNQINQADKDGIAATAIGKGRQARAGQSM